MPKKLKLKSGRAHAIDMLINLHKFQQANADKKWVDGMIKSWVKSLVQNSVTKLDAKWNKNEIPRDVKIMISRYFNENHDSKALKLLFESCITFNIVLDPEDDTDEV